MRWQIAWPDSMSGWCFWASLVALIGVIGVTMAGAAVGATRAEGVAGVLLRIVQFGFAGVIGLFLFGIVCNVAGDIRGKRGREWRL